MERALKLAKKGQGFTSPNPSVGAVIVKNRKIIGEGWHKRAGGDHAEIVAVKSVKNKKLLVGSDLYVTLEPCCHCGKTAPCTEAIVNSGIKRVFIGMKDPFKMVAGNGIKQLRKAGLDVVILDQKDNLVFLIREINQPFLKFVKTGLPYLIMKAGISLDGKISTSKNKSVLITCKKSREDARRERSMCDAVIIGANTVKVDNPELKIFHRYKNKNLFRVILDGRLSLSPDFKIFRKRNVIIITSKNANLAKKKRFEDMGVEVVCLGDETISATELLKFLGNKGVRSVFLEGGSKTHGFFYASSLRSKNLLDKIIFYIAPIIIGDDGSVPVIGQNSPEKLLRRRDFLDVKFKKIASDIKYTAILNRY